MIYLAACHENICIMTLLGLVLNVHNITFWYILYVYRMFILYDVVLEEKSFVSCFTMKNQYFQKYAPQNE